MITSNDTVTDALDQRKQALEAMERIEQMADDIERWRAIRAFMIKLHPEIAEYERIHAEDVKAQRLEQRSLTGSSKQGSIRQLYSMPEWLYRALQAFDPVFEKTQQSKDNQEVKRYNHKIWRAFPAYRVAERI